MMDGDITHLKPDTVFHSVIPNLNLLQISQMLQFLELNLRMVVATSYSAHLFAVEGIRKTYFLKNCAGGEVVVVLFI